MYLIKQNVQMADLHMPKYRNSAKYFLFQFSYQPGSVIECNNISKLSQFPGCFIDAAIVLLVSLVM